MPSVSSAKNRSATHRALSTFFGLAALLSRRMPSARRSLKNTLPKLPLVNFEAPKSPIKPDETKTGCDDSRYATAKCRARHFRLICDCKPPAPSGRFSAQQFLPQ
jgi:hypothetical protein